jgi:FtsP/CotA-like multicopper oxidase with cupredoxin domain
MTRIPALAAGLLLLTACGAPGGGGGSVTVRSVEAVNALPIPELLEGTPRDGRSVFDLTAQAGSTDFGQTGGPADTIGINGSYLGPTLRMVDGQQVRVRLTNQLDEMTTLHWHGMHVPARMDGGPHSMVMPGQTWTPQWRIDQPAATLWYHSHPHGQTAQQVYRGLAGMIILDDPDAPDVGLPEQYGVDDVPLVVQDKTFLADGKLLVDPQAGPSTGFLGDTITTNGAMGTYFDVTTEAVRLRILNGSNARFYNFGFNDGRTFDLVGTDGGLLAAPVAADRVQLGPGERAEVVVRMSAGESVSLNSSPPELGTGDDGLFSGGTFEVLQLRAAQTLTPSPPLATELAQIQDDDPARAITTRTFRIQGRAINGRPMAMDRIDMAVPVDQTEIWEITNADPQPHNFHAHNVGFRVLSVGDQPPAPVQSGYKDTVYVAPRETVRILLKFTDYTDPNWPYMFHCHLLLHEDIGVMGQFVVVKPGQQAGTPPASNHLAHQDEHAPATHD